MVKTTFERRIVSNGHTFRIQFRIVGDSGEWTLLPRDFQLRDEAEAELRKQRREDVSVWEPV